MSAFTSAWVRWLELCALYDNDPDAHDDAEEAVWARKDESHRGTQTDIIEQVSTVCKHCWRPRFYHAQKKCPFDATYYEELGLDETRRFYDAAFDKELMAANLPYPMNQPEPQ